MKQSKYLIMILFFIVILSCSADGKVDHFEGFWCVKSQTRKINEFMTIQKFGGSYLVITSDIDDDGAAKGIGRKKSGDILEVKLRGMKYIIKWNKDELGEWLEMYISFNDEEYPIYERVETFSLDKF